MIPRCDKCGTILNTKRGVIKICYPVFITNKFVNYFLCRGCFIDGDNLRADEFLKWLFEKKVASNE